jgi:hypothetical protein
MKMLDSPECQWIFQGNWIEDGDLGKGWSIFVYRTLELKFEHLTSASAVYRLGPKRTRDSESVVGGTFIILSRWNVAMLYFTTPKTESCTQTLVRLPSFLLFCPFRS